MRPDKLKDTNVLSVIFTKLSDVADNSRMFALPYFDPSPSGATPKGLPGKLVRKIFQIESLVQGNVSLRVGTVVDFVAARTSEFHRIQQLEKCWR